jgi:Family of unknown function (DUF6228)
MREPRELEIGHERVFLRLTDVHDGLTTRSRGGRLDSVHVHLALPNLRADAHVWLAPPGVQAPLTELFDELAEHWRAWDGAKRWRAPEGGLALAAFNDGLGHVTLAVELHEVSGGGWRVRGEVPVDAGALEDLARDVRRFVDP